MLTKKNQQVQEEAKKQQQQHQQQQQQQEQMFQTPYGSPQQRKGATTKITIKFDAGFGNNLYIRGRGANLNWERGQQLRNVNQNEWVFETNADFLTIEYKILLNDQTYEVGHNHLIAHGATTTRTVRF